MLVRHFVVSAEAGGRYDTVINRVVATTARRAHQLCIDDYLETYGLPDDMTIYTRTLFESEYEDEAAEFLQGIFEQMERKNVGYQERHRQRR
jgi:hypothetical protein